MDCEVDGTGGDEDYDGVTVIMKLSLNMVVIHWVTPGYLVSFSKSRFWANFLSLCNSE